jgi:hypothetical protein
MAKFSMRGMQMLQLTKFQVVQAGVLEKKKWRR